MKISFIDTNIWIYAHVKSEDPYRHNAIIAFIEKEIKENQIISSVQVINEFHWVLERKYKFDPDVIDKKVKSIVKISKIVPVSLQTYHAAITIRKKHHLSYWDSLLIASALENDAAVFYSEDMSHGLIINKQLKIVNPFEG